MSIFEHNIQTPHQGFLDITSKVAEDVRKADVDHGIAVIFVPHTTAAVTINENADPDVTYDMTMAYDKAFPDNPRFRHMEGNSAAHCKSSAMGPSLTVIVEGGQLLLGTWQGIYFCEFDGPRNRRYMVKVMKG